MMKSMRAATAAAAVLAAASLAAAPAPEEKVTNANPQNPLLAAWAGPHGGVPPFGQVKVEHFKPALEAAMQEKLAQRYADVFRLFLKHDASRVTFWGVTDADTWLDDFPIRGRTNYPLLWGRDGREKPAFGAVADVLRSRARP